MKQLQNSFGFTLLLPPRKVVGGCLCSKIAQSGVKYPNWVINISQTNLKNWSPNHLYLNLWIAFYWHKTKNTHAKKCEWLTNHGDADISIVSCANFVDRNTGVHSICINSDV